MCLNLKTVGLSLVLKKKRDFQMLNSVTNEMLTKLHLSEQMTKSRANFYFLYSNLKIVGLCPALNHNVIFVNDGLGTNDSLKALFKVHQLNTHT